MYWIGKACERLIVCWQAATFVEYAELALAIALLGWFASRQSSRPC